MSGRLRLLLGLEWLVRVLQRLRLGWLVTAMRRVLERVAGDFVEARVEGMRMRAPIAERGYLELLAERKKDRALVERFVAAVAPGARVLDGGAHWGYFTLLAAQATGPEGRVVSFEPDPRSAERLRWNVRANGFDDRVTVIEAALSDRPGAMKLYAHDRHQSWSSLYRHPGSRPLGEVAVVTVDDAAGDDFDVVKLDVEGAEVAALRGMRGVFAGDRRKPVLFLECHPDALRRAGSSVDELLSQLSAAGYAVRAIDERTGVLGEVEAVLERSLFVNLYCEPAARRESRPRA